MEWRLLFASCFVACASPTTADDLAIFAVAPASGLNTKDTPIVVSGAGFHYAFASDLDRGTTMSLDTVTLQIGSNLLDATWQSETSLAATVPAGLAPGLYDAAVTIGGRTASRPAAFEVLADELPAFGTPTVIVALSSPNVDDDPSMTADRLELFFNSDRPGGVGGGDIWVSTRATPQSPWGPPDLVPNVNTTSGETTPKISADGLTLYLASDRPGGLGGLDIWMSTRATRSEPWRDPELVVELSSGASEAAASPNPSETVLVLSSTRDGNGNDDLFMSTRASRNDSWGTLMPIVEANGGGFSDSDPVVAAQETVLAFSSYRGGGASDLYVTERTAGQPFSTPVPMLELNSGSSDEDPWLTEDLRYVMFASNRDGDFEIYEASR